MNMKTYKIEVIETHYFDIDDADSEEEALEIAKEKAFAEVPDCVDAKVIKTESFKLEEPDELFTKKLISDCDKKDVKLTILQPIEESRQSSLWYGGTVAVISKGNISFEIVANGDIYASLLDRDGNELEWVKDKSNNGTFYTNMAHHICNDETLYVLEKNGFLVFDNNNWWEIFAVIDGKTISSFVADEDKISEVIETVAEEFNDMLYDIRLDRSYQVRFN